MSRPLPASSLVNWWDVHTAAPADSSRAQAQIPRALSRLSVA
jgi:hypothetical protein